jgi:hypothetical protein
LFIAALRRFVMLVVFIDLLEALTIFQFSPQINLREFLSSFQSCYLLPSEAPGFELSQHISSRQGTTTSLMLLWLIHVELVSRLDSEWLCMVFGFDLMVSRSVIHHRAIRTSEMRENS